MKRSLSIKDSDAIRSGEIYRNLYLPNVHLSSVRFISVNDNPECMYVALMPLLTRLSTWSFINEIMGVTTTDMPSRASVGT